MTQRYLALVWLGVLLCAAPAWAQVSSGGSDDLVQADGSKTPQGGVGGAAKVAEQFDGGGEHSVEGVTWTEEQAVTQMRLHINLQQSAMWYGHNVVTPAVLSTDISVAELATILNEVVRLRDSNLASVGVVSEFYGCLQGQRRRRAA